MKNYLVFIFGIAFVVVAQSCTTVYNIGTDGTSKQTVAYVQDDLYDEQQVVFAAKPKKQKKSDYYAPSEDDGIVIEEEEGVSRQTYLNSRSVYSNYDSGYADGFRNGTFSSMAWNNWYSNPYVNFGYSPFRSGINIILGAGSFYNPYSFYNPFGIYSSFYSPFAYSSINPFYDPFYRSYYGGFYPSYGINSGFFGSFYNPYSNPYVYLGGSSGYISNNGNYSYSNNEPIRRVVRGPREDYGSNRYNDSYTGGARNANNQYNNSYNNQVQTANQSQQRNVVQEYQRMQQRRNSNIEYTRPSNNDYQNRDSFYQNRSSNFGSGGGYSGGGGGGGSFSGGGSRGPR